jgi:hypothetical protein
LDVRILRRSDYPIEDWPMTNLRLRSRAHWGGAILMAMLLGTPAMAGAEAEAKAKSQGSNKAASPAKQAIAGAEKHDRITHREEKAIQKLVQLLEEMEREHRHNRHHQGQGAFTAGLQQAGGSTMTSDGSTDTSDSAGGSWDDGTSANGPTGSTGISMSAGAATGPSSTASSAKPASSNSQNKWSKGQQAHRGSHSPFAQGLIHAEREWRELRRERRLERAFVRGLAALREAEQHSAQATANSNGVKSSTASGGTKIASAPTVTTSAKVGATSTKSGEPKWGADVGKHSEGEAAARKSATIHLAEAGKEGHEHMRSRTGALAGRRPSTAQPRIMPPSGSTGHANPGHHAGALAGSKASGHKK